MSGSCNCLVSDMWLLLCVSEGVFGEWVEAPMCFCGCHSASVCEPVPDGSGAFLDGSERKLGPGFESSVPSLFL